jgi:hypothetical protein
MLLLSADSLLLFFITMNLGILSQKGLAKIFRCAITPGFLGIFLLGLIASSIYFNILSFWLPVNYLCLIPLTLLSGIVFLRYLESIRLLQSTVFQHAKTFLSPAHLPITIPLLAVLFYYWIIPPANTDSRVYHYLSILWYEKYKVVPGLANIHGRFGFNPVSFIVQAPYSFTGLIGQSLYPLNGLLIFLLSGWLLVRLFRSGPSPAGLLYAAFIILIVRTLLINISSPSSDTLVAVCIIYSLIEIFKRMHTALPEDRQRPGILVPCVVLIWSLTAKLSSFPVLLALPLVFFWLPKKERGPLFLLKILQVTSLFYLPWLARNYIMSGYFIYPIPSLGWGHPDWQAPLSLLKVEIYFIRIWPKISGFNQPLSAHYPLYSWFTGWFAGILRNRAFGDALLFICSMLSPFFWLLLKRDDRKKATAPFFLWLTAYLAVWIWLFTSPVIRFGSVFLSFSVFFPLAVVCNLWTQGSLQRLRSRRIYQCLIPFLLGIFSVGYINRASLASTTYAFTLADCWLYPLKDISYNDREKADFTSKPLGSGVRLYVSDPTHQCVNACLPCMVNYNQRTPCYFDDIQMRGTRIDQGFRMIRDELPEEYPFIK